MPEKLRRRGRPPLKKGEPKRAAFNTRITQSLRERLGQWSSRAGRSISEEIEHRLERSGFVDALMGGQQPLGIYRTLASLAERIERKLGQSAENDCGTSWAVREAWRVFVSNLYPNAQLDIGRGVPNPGGLDSLEHDMNIARQRLSVFGDRGEDLYLAMREALIAERVYITDEEYDRIVREVRARRDREGVGDVS